MVTTSPVPHPVWKPRLSRARAGPRPQAVSAAGLVPASPPSPDLPDAPAASVGAWPAGVHRAPLIQVRRPSPRSRRRWLWNPPPPPQTLNLERELSPGGVRRRQTVEE